jgi:hypothetical protein
MKVSEQVECMDFPCEDVKHECYAMPEVELNPENVSLIVVSEAAPPNLKDYYYAAGDSLFQQNTIQAFGEAGVEVSSIQDLLQMGIYFTTAVKCGKTGYGIKAASIKTCSHILEKELDLFPNVEATLLMGDVAIKAINYISIRNGEGRAIPAGSTYKIRGGDFTFKGKRAFPSYLQVGPSFGIEKSKQRMIAEDIANAMKLIG